jgi:hypothetical protein
MVNLYSVTQLGEVPLNDTQCRRFPGRLLALALRLRPVYQRASAAYRSYYRLCPARPLCVRKIRTGSLVRLLKARLRLSALPGAQPRIPVK